MLQRKVERTESERGVGGNEQRGNNRPCELAAENGNRNSSKCQIRK